MRQPPSIAFPGLGNLLDAHEIAGAVVSGDRAMLARAITLIESRKEDHRKTARALLTALSSHDGRSHRIGVTGVPGVGKSTLIDRLGMNLIEKGHRVAVLAIDPSSSRSGGSILGDKTRMGKLAVSEAAFIRPSPSAGTLGGVARMTRETILLCEAAGFDIVIVETVGVGQSETAVAGMVDFFLVLMLAGAGDELQGIKKGILELADMIAITKADSGNEERATAAASDYRAALRILTPPDAAWRPPVLTVSAAENQGLDRMWEMILEHRRTLEKSGAFEARRRDQNAQWMMAIVEDQLRDRILSRPEVAAKRRAMEEAVRRGELPPSVAADEILNAAGIPAYV